MFTVRVIERDTTHVTACAQYTVEVKNGRTVLTLYASDGPVSSSVKSNTIALDEGTRAFIMNDNGKTVDMLPRRERQS